MGIASEIARATDNPDKPDLFEHDDSSGLHFPCSSCIHGNKDMKDSPCLGCRYFGC